MEINLPPLFGPNTPKLKAIIYAEFDNEIGRVLRYQVPTETVSKKQFEFISSTIIPSEESRGRIIRLNIFDIKVIGYPVGIRNEKYHREFYIFNLCFVIDKNESGEDTIFEPIVQKFSEYLVNLEKEESFLTKRIEELPEVMKRVFEDLNNTGECVLSVTKETTFYFRLSHSFHGIDPQPMNQFMVPVFIRQPAPKTHTELSKMDVLSQKVCPHINGISCIRDISAKIQIDVGLVGRCLRYLHFGGCITFLPMFLYSNQYMPKQGVRGILEHENVRQKCVEYVRLSSDRPAPSYTDVFRLYVSLGPGITLGEWCAQKQPRQNYNIDERRFVQFGVYFDFIQVAKVYAYIEERIQSIDGTIKAKKKVSVVKRTRFEDEMEGDLNENEKNNEEVLEEERLVHELSVSLAISPFNIIERLENQQKPGILYR